MDLNLEELKNGDYCNAGKIVGTDQYYFEDIDGRYCSVFTEISKEEFDTFEDWGNSLSDQRKKISWRVKKLKDDYPEWKSGVHRPTDYLDTEEFKRTGLLEFAYFEFWRNTSIKNLCEFYSNTIKVSHIENHIYATFQTNEEITPYLMLGTNFLVKIKESNNSLDRTVELFPYQISANECFEYCQKFLIKNLDLSEFTSSPKKAFDWGTVSIVSETDSEVINSKIDHILIEYKNI